MAASADLVVVAISINTHHTKLAPSIELALSHWSEKYDLVPPRGAAACRENVRIPYCSSLGSLTVGFNTKCQLKSQILGILKKKFSPFCSQNCFILLTTHFAQSLLSKFCLGLRVANMQFLDKHDYVRSQIFAI